MMTDRGQTSLDDVHATEKKFSQIFRRLDILHRDTQRNGNHQNVHNADAKHK